MDASSLLMSDARAVVFASTLLGLSIGVAAAQEIETEMIVQERLSCLRGYLDWHHGAHLQSAGGLQLISREDYQLFTDALDWCRRG